MFFGDIVVLVLVVGFGIWMCLDIFKVLYIFVGCSMLLYVLYVIVKLVL